MPYHNEKAKPNKWEEEGSGQRVELNLIMEEEQTRQVQRTQTVVTHMGASVCVRCVMQDSSQGSLITHSSCRGGTPRLVFSPYFLFCTAKKINPILQNLWTPQHKCSARGWTCVHVSACFTPRTIQEAQFGSCVIRGTQLESFLPFLYLCHTRGGRTSGLFPLPTMSSVTGHKAWVGPLPGLHSGSPILPQESQQLWYCTLT